MFKIKIDCTNYIEPKKPHNNQLYYKNQIINKDTKFDFDFKDIFENIIEKCYVLYRTIINTNSKFTYKSLEFEIPSNWKVVKADGVDFEFAGQGHMQNLEYQLVSTLNGLNLTETKYAIKVRGDEYWTDIDKMFHSLKSDEKLLCSSMFFRPLNCPYPFHIGDHIICGTVENMKRKC